MIGEVVLAIDEAAIALGSRDKRLVWVIVVAAAVAILQIRRAGGVCGGNAVDAACILQQTITGLT